MNTLWTGSSSSPLPRHEPGDTEEVAAHLLEPFHDEFNHEIDILSEYLRIKAKFAF